MKLLIIEDSQRLAERIKDGLSKQYVVDVVHTGEEGLRRALQIQYSVIILDLGLPDIAGDVVCRRMREDNVDTPILVLTGHDDMKLRVQLLDMGADDYLTKPFDTAELKARIAALARRQARSYVEPIIRLHDLTINTKQRTVERAGVPIDLRRKEFDILEYLVNNRGRVLTREMILNHAWDAGKNGWNSTVDVHIKHLRDKIDRPFGSSLIKTAYGVGYRVDAPE